jgi:protein-tyrosine phosphatase
MTRPPHGHDYQWVTDRIALGSAVSGPLQVRSLLLDGVSHVLDLRLTPSSESLYAGTGISYLQNGVADDGRPKADAWFFDGIDFVMKALKRPTGRVLVHCKLGMSRSPSMVYAVLRAQGMPAVEAKERISKARLVARVTYPDDAERAGRRWFLRGRR